MLGIEVAQGSVAFPRPEIRRGVGSVVEDDRGLQLSQITDRFLVLPRKGTCVVLPFRPRLPSVVKANPTESQPVDTTAVKPENIELAILRGQLIQLAMILVAHLLGIRPIQVREEKSREPPVERRIIKTYPKSRLAYGLDVLGNKVTMSRRLDRGKVAARIVEQGEPIVMP